MNILNIEPRPLILADRKVVIAWSPKSACSHIAVWFFVKEGLLRAANYYHSWPHSFRAEVYYRSEQYLREASALLAANGQGYTLVKITRDPAKRMVSIFRHACRHTFLHDELRAKLGIDALNGGLSLRQFEEFLSNEKLTVPSGMNFHLCAQSHPVWDMPFDRTITLNMDETPLNPGLNNIETALGLGLTDFAKFPKFEILRKQHYAMDGSFDGPEPIEEHRFLRCETNSFPKKQFEASAMLQDMARRLHAIDYGRVNSGDTGGNLAAQAS